MDRAYKRIFHVIYKTTNLINGKFYIGMHSTDDLNDGYMGSGKILWRSIKKYGKENFITEILEHFQSRDDLVRRERELVNEDLLKNQLCMNLVTGGSGNFQHTAESKRKLSEAAKKQIRNKMSRETKEKISKRHLGKAKTKLHKPIVVNGQEYESLSSASGITGISKSTIWNRTQSEKFKDTYFKDVGKIPKLKKEKLPRKYRKAISHHKTIIVDEIEYESITEASRQIGKSYSQICRWLKDMNKKNVYYKDSPK